MKEVSKRAMEAARYEGLAKQVGDRELRQYYAGRAAAIEKQLEVQQIMDTPGIELAMRRFLGDLRKAGIQVAEMESTIYLDRAFTNWRACLWRLCADCTARREAECC